MAILRNLIENIFCQYLPDKPSFSFLKIKNVEKYCSARWKNNSACSKNPIFSQEFIENPSPGLRLVSNIQEEKYVEQKQQSVIN